MAASVREVTIGGDVVLGGGDLILIAGPCAIESEAHARRMAEAIQRIAADRDMPFVFKASYDKANRSSATSPRGPGLREGLRILKTIREDLSVPVVSDIHAPEQAAPAAEALDMLQIPAFLCRQTDLLAAAGETGKPVNVKKGQFMAPWDMKNAVAKIEHTGNRDIVLTERGVSFGYNTLVSDMRSLPVMRGLGVPVVYDATHSVQSPGGLGNATGGDREMAKVLARAAVAAGVDGVFLEVHDNPDSALSDGPNMINLADLPAVLDTLLAIHAAVR